MRERRVEKWERDIENRKKIEKEEEILKISYLLFQDSYLLSQIEIPEQLSIPSAIYMDPPLIVALRVTRRGTKREEIGSLC